MKKMCGHCHVEVWLMYIIIKTVYFKNIYHQSHIHNPSN